eukprot:Skav206133  [mRNA]  locus=scaffold172:428830:429712:+ [translate_table: standard]
MEESTFERPAAWWNFGEHWCPAGLLSALIVCAAAHTHVARANLRDEEEPEVLVDWKSACVGRAAIEAQANPCRACGRQICRSDFSAVMLQEFTGFDPQMAKISWPTLALCLRQAEAQAEASQHSKEF